MFILTTVEGLITLVNVIDGEVSLGFSFFHFTECEKVEEVVSCLRTFCALIHIDPQIRASVMYPWPTFCLTACWIVCLLPRPTTHPTPPPPTIQFFLV